MIKITSLNKVYKSKKRKRCFALNDVNLNLPDAGLVFVLGKSGSGKSTLLNLIGGLDNVTSGSIEVDGNDLSCFSESMRQIFSASRGQSLRPSTRYKP